MGGSTRLPAWFPALLLLAACSQEHSIEQYRLGAFGTEITITVRHAADEASEATIATIARDFATLHRRWHAWEPGMLTDLNERLAAGERVPIDADAQAIIERARTLARLSEGTFNPAIGRLLALWGFHSSEMPTGQPPARQQIAQLVKETPSMDDLHIQDGFVSTRNPAIQLDFGAYLKGVAVERALETLASSGVEHAIVNAGGDLGVIGHHGERAWRAAIEHPGGEGRQLLASLSVQSGEFVFTSGNYRRYREDEGLRYGHILDPRDGYPADSIQSVTVIARNGGLADAAATALSVAEADTWPRLARSLGIEHVLRVDGEGRISATPAMVERIEWRGERPRIDVVSAADDGTAEARDQVVKRHRAPEVESL